MCCPSDMKKIQIVARKFFTELQQPVVLNVLQPHLEGVDDIFIITEDYDFLAVLDEEVTLGHSVIYCQCLLFIGAIPLLCRGQSS